MIWAGIVSGLGARLARVWSWLGWMALAYVFAPVSAYVVWKAAGYGEAARAGDPAALWLGLACLGALTLIPALTIGRGNRTAFLVALPLLLLAGAYQGVTAAEHLMRTLASKASAAEQSDRTYADARAELTRLQAERSEIATKRSVREIEARLWEIQTTAGDTARTSRAQRQAAIADPATPAEVRRLMEEMGAAERRDRLDGEIKAASAAYRAAAPTAAGDAAGNMARLRAWIARQTGLKLADQADLRALLLLLVIEVGSITAPAVVAVLRRADALAGAGHGRAGDAAGGGRDQPVLTHQQFADLPEPLVAPATRDAVAAGLGPEAVIVGRWCAERVTAPEGGWSRSAALYADYAAYCRGLGVVPLPQGRWGAVMNQDLGHAGRKRGKNGNRCYPLTLKGSAGGAGQAPDAALAWGAPATAAVN